MAFLAAAAERAVTVMLATCPNCQRRFQPIKLAVHLKGCAPAPPSGDLAAFGSSMPQPARRTDYGMVSTRQDCGGRKDRLPAAPMEPAEHRRHALVVRSFGRLERKKNAN